LVKKYYLRKERMAISEKQLKANKENAKKGGVKTDEGKALVKYNAIKHGLLAKEVVINIGEGAENPEEFNALLEDLKTQLNPVGTIEEMLLEKIAVAYWRFRRACRYEVGLIRQELDTATDDYYNKTNWLGKKTNKTEEEIELGIEEERESLEAWGKDKKDFVRMQKKGKSLEETYGWEDNWEWLEEKLIYLLEGSEDYDGYAGPKELKEFLNTHANWSDDAIWEALIGLCDEMAEPHRRQVVALEKEKEKNSLRLQVIKKLGNIPSRDELDRLLRYEGAMERQFYKALNQLERQQRLRLGDMIIAPVEVDLSVNTG
jgi:hypothetical protein